MPNYNTRINGYLWPTLYWVTS